MRSGSAPWSILYTAITLQLLLYHIQITNRCIVYLISILSNIYSIHIYKPYGHVTCCFPTTLQWSHWNMHQYHLTLPMILPTLFYHTECHGRISCRSWVHITDRQAVLPELLCDSLQANAMRVPKLGYSCSCPQPFQLFIH